MASPGDHDDVPHTLIPFALAIGLIRQKAYGPKPHSPESDPIALANFTASIVPVYEYAPDPSRRPRILTRADLAGGLFREGGKELRYLDGRPARRYLAVNAADVECVIAVLKSPHQTAMIRSRFVRLRSRKLQARAEALRAKAEVICAKLLELRMQVEIPEEAG